MCLQIIYIWYIYKEALNNLQWLICHKTKQTKQTKPVNTDFNRQYVETENTKHL